MQDVVFPKIHERNHQSTDVDTNLREGQNTVLIFCKTLNSYSQSIDVVVIACLDMTSIQDRIDS